MIKYVTALYECGWCLKTEMGRTPKDEEEISADPDIIPEGWRFVHNSDLAAWRHRQKGTCKITICMGLVDVMCVACEKEHFVIERKQIPGTTDEIVTEFSAHDERRWFGKVLINFDVLRIENP